MDERGQEMDPWQFRQGRVLALEGVACFPIQVAGDSLDFCWAAFAIPVVHERVVQLFERLGVQDVQFIPAKVAGAGGAHFILNALRVIRCIDDARSEEVQHWTPEDGEPEKTGEYRSIIGLRIHPAKVGDARIFRPWGWRIALIVSEDLQQAIEAGGISGVRFTSV
ncbi:imm11 family protein [Stigmatella aurantiaca]|nr:DUF1629 domain-containing protein [Stigmatella aurantiaca]